MYISLDWINELVNLENIKLEDLINKLTLSGFEVEEILEIEVNNKPRIILDISATANRADSLSIKGITKEIAALVDKPVTKSKFDKFDFSSQSNIQNTFINSSKSSIYSNFIAITVENLVNFNSPNWLKEKLLCSGLKPLNNFLDFQTYILLETGYPFEFYDLENIRNLLKTSDFELKLKTDNTHTSLIASNGNTYQLKSDTLTLQANGYPLSIAGIIPNKTVCLTKDTKSLLIEGSIFNSKKIRQQSRKIGLRTERSARYEKGLNNHYFNDAILKLIYLLKISNPQLVCKIHTTSYVKQDELPIINLYYSNVTEILGPTFDINNKVSVDLSITQITDYLNRLNFIFSFNKDELAWSVNVPEARVDDISREIDLIEEIGRLHGFNNFVTNLPNVYKIGTEDFSYQLRKKLTNLFLNEGFDELVQYSLVNQQVENNIRLINPLIKDYSTLRKSLLPNLIKLESDSVKQGNGIIEGFEYGHTFSGDIKSHYFEKEVVSGIFGGFKIKREWNDGGQTLSWFEAKGKIEDLFKKLNITIRCKCLVSKNHQHLLHPYRAIELFLDTKVSLGVFGQIHPVLAKKNDIPANLFLFEFNLEVLRDEFQNQLLPLYKPYSSYPKITKDLSFIVSQKITFHEIENIILNKGTKFLKTVALLDEYQGNSIPKDQTSLCIQLTFQSDEKTLLTKEVDEIVHNLQIVLENKYNIIIRL